MQPYITKCLYKASAYVIKGNLNNNNFFINKLKVYIYKKCYNVIAKFSYYKCVLGLGYSYTLYYKGNALQQRAYLLGFSALVAKI